MQPASMYLPDQLALMKLGIHKRFVPRGFTHRVGVPQIQQPLAAWGRPAGAQRIDGFNDEVGDCMPTGIINGVIDFLTVKGVTVAQVPNQLALDLYSATMGYVKGDASTDNGTDPDQFFAWWKQNEILGTKLVGVDIVDPRNEMMVKRTVDDDGFVGLVLDLTLEQQNQIIWSATPKAPQWGWHYVNMDGYAGPYTATSWGLEKLIDESFFDCGQVSQVYKYTLSR